MTKIGDYTLHTIDTGTFRLDAGAMFGIIPKALWERRTRADDRNRIPLAMRCLLLEGDGRLILIDNGIGDKYDARFAELLAIDHETNTLERSLKNLGYSTDDVTDVVLTHLHFDHAGGSTRRVGDALEVAFPRATYHVQVDHWVWASVANPREKASFLKENLEPLASSGQLQLAHGDADLFPGISPILIDGHTKGQQAIKISDGENTLVFVADLIPTAAHVPPVWCMAYDLEPLKSISEKESLLQQALAEGWNIFLEHDPDVEVLDVEQIEGKIRGTNARPLKEL